MTSYDDCTNLLMISVNKRCVLDLIICYIRAQEGLGASSYALIVIGRCIRITCSGGAVKNNLGIMICCKMIVIPEEEQNLFCIPSTRWG